MYRTHELTYSPSQSLPVTPDGLSSVKGQYCLFNRSTEATPSF